MINFDVDIDVSNRDDVLALFPEHTVAAIKNKVKHNSGVYFQRIPKLPVENISAIDYKTAQRDGWFKIDFLNNSIYTQVKSEDHLNQLINTEPMWELLEHREVVEQLYHINNHYALVAKYKPKSIMQLAMLLAIIRPAKKHLIGKSWDDIEKEVWVTPETNEYFFKKSHSVAFASAIVVQLNLLVELLIDSSD